jgi:hypothetical protein
MRVWAMVLVLLVAIVASFAMGRATAPEGERSDTDEHDVVLQLGDQLRFPDIALFCTTDFEIDRAKLLCNRTDDGARYQVVFERDRTKLGRLGFPGNQRVFLERP